MLSFAPEDFSNDTRTSTEKYFSMDEYNFGDDSESGSTEVIVVKKREKGYNKDGNLRKERYYGRYKYVYWKSNLRKFKASIVTKKKTQVLGTFETQEEAASQINNQCIALGIPLKNPSICFEKPELALRFMNFEISQKYVGVLFLPKINKYIGYLFVHKDQEATINAGKKRRRRRRSKSPNGSKLALYQDQYKFTGFASTEIEAAQQINKYCVQELNIPPKFPCLSIYGCSSGMGYKKTARKTSHQKQISSLCFDDDAHERDEYDDLVVYKKSYLLRKRKAFTKPDYVDYTLADDLESKNIFSDPIVYKKRKLNNEKSLEICRFPQTTAVPAVQKSDFIEIPTNSNNNEANSRSLMVTPTTSPSLKKKKSRDSLPSPPQIAAQQDYQIPSKTDEDKDLASKDALSEYIRWNSYAQLWTASFNYCKSDFFVGNFHSKKHAINALIGYCNKLDIPLSEHFCSFEVEENSDSTHYYTTDSGDSSAENDENSIDNISVKNCAPPSGVTKKLWSLADLAISHKKESTIFSKNFIHSCKYE